MSIAGANPAYPTIPGDVVKKHGPTRVGDEDTSNPIALRTLDEVVSRAQALSRKLVAGKKDASVDDFLADRARESNSV